MVFELRPLRAPGMAADAAALRPQISGYVALIVDLDLTLGTPPPGATARTRASASRRLLPARRAGHRTWPAPAPIPDGERLGLDGGTGAGPARRRGPAVGPGRGSGAARRAPGPAAALLILPLLWLPIQRKPDGGRGGKPQPIVAGRR
jgi:hypothetical protein